MEQLLVEELPAPAYRRRDEGPGGQPLKSARTFQLYILYKERHEVATHH